MQILHREISCNIMTRDLCNSYFLILICRKVIAMKRCNNCGYTTNDDACVFCLQCGMSMGDINGSSNVIDNISVAQQNSADNGTHVQKKNKPKKKKILLIGIPVLSVIVIAITVICVIACMIGGPFTEVIDAAVNTVEAESFSFTAKAGDESVKGKVAIDFDKKDIQVVLTYSDGDVIAIYDDYLIFVSESRNSYGQVEYKYKKSDISNIIDTCFENWDSASDILDGGDIDWNMVIEVADDLFNTGMDKSDVEEHVDLEKASEAIKNAFFLLNDEEWLDEAADFEEKTNNGVTTYYYDFDFGDVSDATKDTFRDCLESSDAKDLLDDIADYLEDLEESDFYARAEISIENDYIKEANVKIGKGSFSLRYKLEISDVGSTQIDTDELQEYLDKCK